MFTEFLNKQKHTIEKIQLMEFQKSIKVWKHVNLPVFQILKVTIKSFDTFNVLLQLIFSSR